jgi:DNA-binding LacI/PurR family transcriptional regulator
MPQLVKRARGTHSEGSLRSIRAVADRARVSIATVSRTINRVPTVNAKLAKRVHAAISELGYIPNTQARALGSGRSRVIGLIVSEFTNPFFPELIQGFEDVAIEEGFELLISSTNHDPKRMEVCIRRLLQQKVEGVAILTFGIEQPLVEQLAERNIPLVFVDSGPDRASISLLKIDYHLGIRQGVQHLAALGHRTIGFISGPMSLSSARARMAAFLQSLKECGIQPNVEWQMEGDHTLEGGVMAMERILAASSRPTAIMCSNDLTAIGVLQKSYQAGIRIPQDMSIIGFDDIQMSRMTIPPLTSIQISRTALANLAMKALKAHIEGNASQREYNVDTRLVVRESSTFPSGAMADLKTNGDSSSRSIRSLG